MRSPFRFGPPISSADEFFGREQVIDELLSLLAHGTPCSIVGERRVGKTSLLLRIADPGFRNLVETRMGPVLVVYLDFQGHRDLTVETFWRVLIEEVAQQAQAQVLDERVLRSLQELQAADVLNVSDVRRLVVEFARAGTRLLILFDEFEYVADSNALDLPFFGGLRSLVASNLPVTCITASRKSLSEIDRFASGYSFVSSPFFNVFTTFRLGAFEERAAIALLTESLRGTGVEFDVDDFEFLYELSGYHPFFLQMVAYYLFEESKKQPQVSSRERRLSARSRFSEQCHAHFDYYWSISTDTEKAVLTAYALDQSPMAGHLGEGQQIQSEMAVRSLADRVLLVPGRDEDGSYRLVSASLADWIREAISAEARPSTAVGLTPEDFKRLPQDGARFEALVRQLLEAMGYHLLEEPVADADSGPDILAERVVKDAAMERRERVVVECKHYAHSGKAVSSRDVGAWHDALTSHGATGYLLVTDTRLTENLARFFRDFTEDEANRPRWATFWDVDELINHLNEYPGVRDIFFYPDESRRYTEQMPEHQYRKGIGHFLKYQWVLAIEELQQVVAQDPGFEDAADKLVEAQRYARAERLFEQAQRQIARGDWEEAVELLEEVESLKPPHLDLTKELHYAKRKRAEIRAVQQLDDWYDEGVAQLAAGNLKQAKMYFDRIYHREPDFRDVVDRLAEMQRESVLNQLFERANQHEAAGEWEQAIGVLREVLEIDPPNREAIRSLVRATRRVERMQGEFNWVTNSVVAFLVGGLCTFLITQLAREILASLDAMRRILSIVFLLCVLVPLSFIVQWCLDRWRSTRDGLSADQ